MGGQVTQGGIGTSCKRQVKNTSGRSVIELENLVAQLVEERETLRRALQDALLEAMQREEKLRIECQALRLAGHPTVFDLPKDDIGTQIAVAVEEEARAARAA